MSSGRIRLALRAPEGDQDQENPFAPPPEGTPDRPWQPRQPSGSGGSGGSDGADSGSGSGSGSPDGSGSTPPNPPQGAPQPWGSQWSSRQPQGGRPDPYGQRPDPMQGPTGPQGTGPRFDPTDPAHRRSRYALFFGSCGLLFALLGWTPVGLLLGALALYWGISALRMPDDERAQARAAAASALADATQSPRPAPPAPGPDAQRSFVTAAWTGIVASGLALVIVAGTYAFHLAYRDYYTCRQDALTTPAAHACQKLLPKPLRDIPSMRP